MLAEGDAIATAVLSIALFVLLGPQFAGLGVEGLLLAQLACFALPALTIASIRTHGVAVLGICPVSTRTLAATALLASTLWIWVVHWIAPLGASWSSPERAAELEAVFALPSRPLWMSILYFAVVPAFCEELLHRGLLLPALCKTLGARAGILAGSLLFGLSHFNLARLLPTATLGLVAGTLRTRTGSLIPSILLHALYNTCLLVAADANWAPASPLALPAALLSGLAITALWSATREKRTRDKSLADNS